MRFLLIDDNPGILDCLSKLLSLKGHVSAIFTNPEQAVKAFARDEFDVVITDLNLPGMSGLELTEAVKAHNPDTHVLVTTGCSDLSETDCYNSDEIHAFLHKPIDLEHLFAIILNIEKELRIISTRSVK